MKTLLHIQLCKWHKISNMHFIFNQWPFEVAAKHIYVYENPHAYLYFNYKKNILLTEKYKQTYFANYLQWRWKEIKGKE